MMNLHLLNLMSHVVFIRFLGIFERMRLKVLFRADLFFFLGEFFCRRFRLCCLLRRFSLIRLKLNVFALVFGSFCGLEGCLDGLCCTVGTNQQCCERYGYYSCSYYSYSCCSYHSCYTH